MDILDALPLIIVMVDRDGRIEMVNRCFEKFSGVSASNARGKLIDSLIPWLSGQLRRRIAEAIELGRSVTMDRVMLRDGKAPRYYSLQIHPLSEESSGMAVIRIDDISEQVRIEETLIQTEKMMMSGSFAAGLAQEINDPLGVIMQHSQNIERRISPAITANLEAARELDVSLDDVRAYLDKRGIPGFVGQIREAGVRASRIITAMLYSSRGSQPFREPADLAAVLDHALELAGSFARMAESLHDTLRRGNDTSSQVAAASEHLQTTSGQIATAAEEQSATTGDITQNIHKISEVVQETAQRSQESATDAARLAKLSEELRSLVNRFKLA